MFLKGVPKRNGFIEIGLIFDRFSITRLPFGRVRLTSEHQIINE